MKKIKKHLKKSIALAIVVAVLFSYFTPIMKVSATTYGSGEKSFSLGIDEYNGFTVNSVTINESPWTDNTDVYLTADGIYTIVFDIAKKGDEIPDVSYCGGTCGSHFTKTVAPKDGSETDYIITIVADNPEGTFAGMRIETRPSEGVDDGYHFDGRAVVLWSCGTGVCFHHFNDIPSFDDGNSTFYQATEIEADNKPGTTFDINATYKGWYLEGTLSNWVESYEQIKHEAINWDTLDPKLVIGEPIDMRQYEEEAIAAGLCQRPAENASGEEWGTFQGCVDDYAHSQGKIWTQKLQPVGEPTYKNAYISYGDRNFKVAIINDNYKGVTIGSLEDLDYYPAQWANAYIRRDHFDISETTKNKPTAIDTILLEDEINIRALSHNGFAIKSIEPLDVPEDAVTVTKVNGEFNIAFSSNFYDNVIFKVTDNDNEVSYMQIKRTTIDGYLQHVEDNKLALAADFYFDREKSYQDFIITAKVYYNDGSTKNVTLEPQFGIDDGLYNITPDYEADEEHPMFGPPGKGLKKSYFLCMLEGDTEESIDKVYLNAEYTGSDETTYAGAYVGSGEGVLANIYKPEEGEGE